MNALGVCLDRPRPTSSGSRRRDDVDRQMLPKKRAEEGFNTFSKVNPGFNELSKVFIELSNSFFEGHA